MSPLTSVLAAESPHASGTNAEDILVSSDNADHPLVISDSPPVTTHSRYSTPSPTSLASVSYKSLAA